MIAKHVLSYRRKREGRTNYKRRLALLKSSTPRLVIRKSNKYIQLQIIRYEQDGDRILASISSKALAKQGWKHGTNSIPAAYLAGIMLGKAAKEKGVEKAIVDLGLQFHHPGGKLYAAAKGVMDTGVEVPVGDNALPSEERLYGGHLKITDETKALAKKLGA